MPYYSWKEFPVAIEIDGMCLVIDRTARKKVVVGNDITFVPDEFLGMKTLVEAQASRVYYICSCMPTPPAAVMSFDLIGLLRPHLTKYGNDMA